jgi:membrane protease subunit HflC
MSFKNSTILFSLLAVLILFNSFFIVDEREKAIVLQFGETVKEDVGVGFHFKVPIIQEVKKFDARLRSLDEDPDRILTNESKYLLVDSFVKYKISDVLLFYKATGGSFNNLNNLLGQRTEFELKNQFGKRSVTEVVSGERDELMRIMRDNLATSVVDLGIEVIDFRVKRIDLPPELSNSVYERMRTERNRLAEELRSEGKELSREITASADKDRIIILAEANKLSQQLRGEGEATAAAIYAEAHNKDPEWYEFIRTMELLPDAFNNKSDVMLIDSNQEILKYFKDTYGEKK